jgi:ABC-type uncharacterized transport system involved in gliding motility auxiliary subunit
MLPVTLKHRARMLLPVLAVLTLAVALNFWALRFPARVDLTSGGVYSISKQTEAVIEQLPAPVTITFFYDTRSRAMQDAKYLLEQYARSSAQITLASHDPTLEPAVAEEFAVKFAGSAIFTSGSRRVVANNPGETEFTNALIRATSDAVGTVCFTDGHVESNPFSLQSHDHYEQGEEGDHGHSHASGGRPLTLHERHGMGMARNALEVLGYQIEQRLLVQGPAALVGCSVVIVASPQAAFSDLESAQLKIYLEGGGALLLLLEPQIESGLEALLATYGIAISAAQVEDPEHHYWTDAATPAVTDYARHRITRRLALTFFPGAAELAPHPGGVPADTVVVPLVETSASAHLAGGNPNETRPRALLLLVAPETGGWRLAVAGDGDFATNSFFAALGNGQLFLNLVSELADHSNLIDIAPRDYAIATLRMSNAELRATFLLTTIVGPATMFALALWVGWRRY